MDDPNNRAPAPIKEEPPTSTEDTTCASTVGTSQQHPTLQEQRSLLRQQVLHLGVASTSSLGVLVLMVVPIHILMCFGVVVSCWLLLLWKVFQTGQLEYENALSHRGFGEYLPAGLYDQLVNLSFHEFMINGTFVQEYQHLALYFMPGLSAEQLTAYVERLVPRHRRVLQRAGLGNFLGPEFMRHVVGDEGLQGTTSRTVPRRLEIQDEIEDNASGLGEDEDGSEGLPSPRNVSRLLETGPIVEDRALPRAAIVLDDDASLSSDEEEEDLAVNETVIWDAAASAVTSYSWMAVNVARNTIQSTLSVTSGRVFRATVGLSVLSIGAGLFGMWAGYVPREIPREMPQLPAEWIPTRSVVVTSTAASGATASLFMLFGWNNAIDKASDPGIGKKKKKTI